jgi:2-haloacid dehalogenase
MEMNLRSFAALTFDCYGTLINWEEGILGALAPLRQQSKQVVSDDDVLERYAISESRMEADEYKSYREVLANVGKEMAAYLGVSVAAGDDGFLADSIADWMPFPDTVDSLAKLKDHFKLGIISNIDDDLFALSAKRLQVPFDHVVTAEQVGSYKPSHNNFNRAIEIIGLPKDKILHVAQSIYHDIEPANELGLANVWVNRRRGKPGSGATHPATATPTLEVPDLATLVSLL